MTTPVRKEEAYKFLDSHPGWLILSTVGKDGYPHSVPLSYLRRGDEAQRRLALQDAKND